MPKYRSPALSNTANGQDDVRNNAPKSAAPGNEDARETTVIVYCEGHFGAIAGKTANGLDRDSERFKIRSLINSEKAD